MDSRTLWRNWTPGECKFICDKVSNTDIEFAG